MELPCTDPSGGVEVGIGCLGSRRTVICRASRRVSCSIYGVEEGSPTRPRQKCCFGSESGRPWVKSDFNQGQGRGVMLR